jgi:hypothetical protein
MAYERCGSLARESENNLSPRLAAILLVVCLLLAPPLSAQDRIALAPLSGIAPVQFTRLVSIIELDDGSIIVGDRTEKRLVHMSFDGTIVRDIGRSGSGPREFQGVGELHRLGPDSILFTDSYNFSWHFISAGAIVETHSSGRPLVGLLKQRLGGTDEQGQILGVTQITSPEAPRSRADADSLFLVLADRSSNVVDTIGVLRGSGEMHTNVRRAFRGGSDAVFAGNPLDTENLAVLFRDGWIAVARVSPYRVDWRDPEGSWIRGPPLPFEVVQVTHEEQCALQARIFPDDWTCDPTLNEPWPETIPPFATDRRDGDIFQDPDGSVIIRRVPTAAHTNPHYDVVSRDGRLIGVVELRENERILGFGHGSVYVVEKNSLTDLETIRRHPW